MFTATRPRSSVFCGGLVMIGTFLFLWTPQAVAQKKDPKIEAAVSKSLDFLAREQHRQGYWEATGGQFKIPMTALSGVALSCEGSTTTRGKYAPKISRAVDYLLDAAQPKGSKAEGLIGFPDQEHYIYGHGFSMLFLSQVFGEEEDADRRARLQKVLEKAVSFSAKAQTSRGGWGYVSAADGNDFDEGSTCITQVQGLRACRNAGIVVPKEIIDKAKRYIHDCMAADGGVQYSIRGGGGSRPPITAAAVAAMFSAGEYDESDDVKKMLEYCKQNVWSGSGTQANQFGHWHYTHYYFAQVMYRDEKEWDKYLKDVGSEILRSQLASGAWNDQTYGPVYTTAINSTILQLDKGFLPIYQR